MLSENTRQLLKRKRRKGNSLLSKNFSTTLGSKDTIIMGKVVGGGRNLLLKEQRQQIQKELRSVKGSLAIEGLILTKEEEELVISNALGQITDEEFDKRVLDLINNE